MRGDQVIARKRSPPIALAARDKYDLAPFVGEPIERLLDCEIGAPLSLSSASQKCDFYHAFACGASMKGLACKAPSGVLLHPQPKVPRGL